MDTYIQIYYNNQQGAGIFIEVIWVWYISVITQANYKQTTDGGHYSQVTDLHN